MLPNVPLGLKEYITDNKVSIIGKGGNNNKLIIILDNFNPDTKAPAIMIRESPGAGGDRDIPSMNHSMVQIWTRTSSPEQAFLLMQKIDEFLHRTGPQKVADDLFIWHMERNTNPQRLDDPDSKYCQYFCVYNLICRKTINGI